MRDEGLTTAPELSPSQAAVNYLLQRMRVDADLRHHLLYTEAFARLCKAEAVRTLRTVEEVTEHYSTLAPHCRRDKPQLVVMRETVRAVVGDLCELQLPKAARGALNALERLT